MDVHCPVKDKEKFLIYTLKNSPYFSLGASCAHQV